MDFKLTISAFLLFTIITSCNRRSFHASDIEEKTKEHKTVAILPFDIEVTGRLPKGWDEAQKQEVIETESEIFQHALISQILNTSTKRRGKFTVSFQSVDKTRAIFSKNAITYADFKNKDPQELANLLGVDAVFKVKMHKKRYLSNVESIAVGQGVQILRNVVNVPTIIPSGIGKTNDVRIVGSLVNGEDGTILYNFTGSCATDWSRQPEAVVNQISRWIGKKFPYRP